MARGKAQKFDLPEDLLAIDGLPAHLMTRTDDKTGLMVMVGAYYEQDGVGDTDWFAVSKPYDAKAVQAAIDKEVAPLLRGLFGPKPETPEGAA